MNATWTTIFCALAAAASPAAAQPAPAADVAARCEQGVAFARGPRPDLPRAALYLENCDRADLPAELAEQVTRTRAEVAHKLDASKLSAMTVVTTPEGMVAETDAMPGERFTTPATIWTKAGDYTINIAPDAATLDARQGQTATASLDPFSRRTVVITAPRKRQTEPRAGKVDFRDEAEETTSHAGPPPAQKFGSIMPDKYRKKPERSGPLLEDPLADRPDSRSLAWKFGARVGGGVFVHDTSNATGSVSVSLLAARPLVGPVSLAARVGWLRRDVDAGTVEVGVGIRLASTSSLVLRATGGLRGEVRLQDQLAMQEVARVGVGAAVGLDLSLLSQPLTIGLRLEPAFTELTPGTRAHATMLELGYDVR